jgi:hypothetical protein
MHNSIDLGLIGNGAIGALIDAQAIRLSKRWDSAF